MTRTVFVCGERYDLPRSIAIVGTHELESTDSLRKVLLGYECGSIRKNIGEIVVANRFERSFDRVAEQPQTLAIWQYAGSGSILTCYSQ